MIGAVIVGVCLLVSGVGVLAFALGDTHGWGRANRAWQQYLGHHRDFSGVYRMPSTRLASTRRWR